MFNSIKNKNYFFNIILNYMNIIYIMNIDTKNGKIKKIFLRIKEDVCEHNMIIKINKNLNFCQECGRITFTQKKRNHILTKFIIKPKSYYKPIDFSPLDLLNNISIKNNTKGILLNFTNFYLEFRNKQINLIYLFHKHFQSSLTTLYLSIQNLDRIFSSYKFKNIKNEKKITLLTICTYIITYKFIEIDSQKYHLNYSYFIENYNISKNEFLEFELKCVKRLDYNINLIDIYGIIQIIMYIGFIFNNEDLQDISINKIYKNIINLLDDIILNEKILKKFTNKQIAFSIIYITRKKFGLNEKIFREEFSDMIFEYEYELYEKCIIFIEEYLDKNNNKIKKNYSNNLTVEKTKENIEKSKEKEKINIISSLSPEIKSNNKINFSVFQSLKPIKLKTVLNNVNSNKLNDIDGKRLNSPILNPNREKNEKIKINLTNLKNYENTKYLLENQRNNVQPIHKPSRNLQKKLNFTNTQFFDKYKSNLLKNIDKQENIHERIFSDDHLTTLKHLNDLERINVNNDLMNNDFSLSKPNNNSNNNSNYFNKTTKNFNYKNENNINLKLTFNNHIKLGKIIFQDKI